MNSVFSCSKVYNFKLTNSFLFDGCRSNTLKAVTRRPYGSRHKSRLVNRPPLHSVFIFFVDVVPELCVRSIDLLHVHLDPDLLQEFVRQFAAGKDKNIFIR